MMPRLDGFQLLSAVRADAALASVAVVLLSARAGEEARIEGLDSGADDYLVKPFSARELLARIGSLLELRRIRAQAESALRQRTAQFESLLDAAPLGVFLVDADFRVREANPTARNAFDAVPEPVGVDFDALARRLWLPEHAEEIVRTFRHALATGEAYFVPERVERRRDRDVVEYYEWQVSRIPLPEGRFGVVCYFRDISAHVHARLQLEQADRQKDEFLAMLAHELRNPLAPIRNAGEILSRLSSRDPRAQAAVGIVQRQILALTRLVDDLLDVSRITQGRIELQLRIIQLSDVVAQAVEIVDPLLQERRHELSTTSHGQLRVHGDLARLVQCVANVLTNAAKYTDRGGRIQLEVRDDGGEAVISVTDNGIGIPPELQPKVFDLFVQGDRALDRAQGGLGIGLSVVKRLVDMHGGTVSVASEGAGRGSRFEIRLPTLAKDVVAEDRPPVPEQSARRVLIVDDNVDAADSLTMILRLDGHEVECAYTARDGLAQAIRFRPDAAFLDIGLPGMNGYELASRMREDPQLAGAYLVALTGYGQADDKVRARDSGFDAHLVKPANLRALQEILASIRRSPPR
jgi:signal transduction histidine kinase